MDVKLTISALSALMDRANEKKESHKAIYSATNDTYFRERGFYYGGIAAGLKSAIINTRGGAINTE